MCSHHRAANGLRPASRYTLYIGCLIYLDEVCSKSHKLLPLMDTGTDDSSLLALPL